MILNKKVDKDKDQKIDIIVYVLFGLVSGILLLVLTGWKHGWLTIPFSCWIAWLRWKRLEWREEQLMQGIDPDAEWRPWKLNPEEAKKRILEK